MHWLRFLPSRWQRLAALPSALLVLLGGNAHGACTARALIQRTTDAHRLAQAPQLVSTEAAPVRAASLHEQSLASDGHLYAALWTPTQAWVLRYGGLDGARTWFGPFSLAQLDLSGCKPALALMPSEAHARPPRVRVDEPTR